ncbi:unnamed protein product [Dovyalis caffra]|uniref:CTLH domain-containing protein n=1 Tax=Dovyalis caffra TaxID=77055 RepID=A0AAV1SPC4_9ROSI|nr:unnamed protein product [Dovyalis caffra]
MGASSTMNPVHKDLLTMILQFLRDEDLKDTAHALERETGIFFDAKHFEIMVLQGKLDEAESYISGFTNVHENLDSTRIFFELRKQKFLEALDRQDRPKALEILMKDFKDFSNYNEKLLMDATVLLTMEDFRKYGALCRYGDVKIERIYMMDALKKFISDNPVFKGKMHPPAGRNAALLRLLVRGDNEGSASKAMDLSFSSGC